MPPPKKAAKKAAGLHDKHHQANDLRRAYEHMGRVAVLRQTSQSSTTDDIDELTTLAQQAIKSGHNKEAADLLRASEHFSFAALAGVTSGVIRISAELKQSIAEHFDELKRRGDEHWVEGEENSNTLARIYQIARNSATEAFKARAYHEALEYARAAEALAHVKQHASLKVAEGNKTCRSKALDSSKVVNNGQHYRSRS